MPNTKSAKKALRVSINKRAVNTVLKNKLKKSLKDLRKDIKEGSANAKELLSKAYSFLDKAMKGNILHKNKVARKKSRLNNLVKSSLQK
jgi:small subunit ribosomal protein S20